jgi:choline dehydrogenase
MLSGVGPAEHLQDHGIPVILDLPGVGQGLRDHFAVPINYHCKRPISLAAAELAENQDLYMSSHEGPLTSTLVEASALLKSDPACDAPDLAINMIPNYFADYGFKTYDGHAFTLTVNLRQTESVGSVTLFSKDPAAPPRLRANYLSRPSEQTAIREGIRMAREIARQKAFDPYRGRELGPGESARSDREIMDHVRSRGQTEFHPIGTCRMGRDKMAVVDQFLRVHGVGGLRIADASVMPADLSSPTNVAAIMIGERAADMILQDAGSTRLDG